MQLQTRVDVPSYPFEIGHKDRMTFIGSCFADNIGGLFAQNKLDTLTNPYGVLYNPASVCQCIDSIIADDFDESLMVEYEGIWHSFLHHGIFSNTDKTACITNIKAQHKKAQKHLLTSDVLFVTLGTAHIFEYGGRVVSNCHKLPASRFTRRRLSVSEVVSQMRDSLAALRKKNPKIKILFTVSPVRYAKDGMSTNSLSKATLLLAIEELCQNEDYYYFPAYEVVLDELRDYRFFAEDMTHPNSTAINYLWEKIEKTFFNEETIQLNKRIGKIRMAAQHRPFNTNPEAHQLFLSAMLKKASNLQSKHPELDLTAEINYFSKK